jgi:AAT family amino acid transporter
VNSVPSIERERGLRKELSKAQIVMIGLGGAIGTGLFMGSGVAIGYAGPAVILSYAIAGFAALVMVFSLSEMAVVHPAAGSFGTYAEMYLNPWAGFVVRYTYWISQVIAIGGEAVAAGVYMTHWFPDIPVWSWSIGFTALLIYVNSLAVGSFGSVEYGFAFIKVAAIVLFIILGISIILGIGHPPVGFRNLAGLPGGFTPHGLVGVWMAVIVGVFSFNGIEVIAVTSGEAKDPQIAVPAALSSMNTNVYLCSRMLFSLSRASYAPSLLGKLGKTGAPASAILASGACILMAASVSILTPDAYNCLFGVALFGAITVWTIVLLSHLSFRRHHRLADLPVRTPLFPGLQLSALVLLFAVLITMGLDTEFWNISWIVGVPWLALLAATYLFRVRKVAVETRAQKAHR